jgi:thermolabile hemolysin
MITNGLMPHHLFSFLKLTLFLSIIYSPFNFAGEQFPGFTSLESALNFFGSTTTYLRCWYRTSKSHNDPSTAWVWGRDEKGKYFKLKGYWYSSFGIKNMFYTNVSRKEVEKACLKAIPDWATHEGLLYYAADTHFSYNDTIWFNDKQRAKKINKIVAFGDSLSDTGNVFNASDWLMPNPHSWFLGHFSNGLVWTEYLARDHGVPLYNWAVGGAAGRDQYGIVTGIHSQVKSFLEYIHYAVNFSNESTLFTLEFGLNDFVNYDRPIEEVKKDFSNAIDEIINAGAKNLLILTLPDATVAPQFKYSSEEKTNRVKEEVASFNAHIKKVVSWHNKSSVNIVLFDTAGLFVDITQNAKKYGFANEKDPCLDIHRDNAIDYLSEHALTEDCKANGADKYIFWGVTHPTTASYRFIADRLNKESMHHFVFENE